LKVVWMMMGFLLVACETTKLQDVERPLVEPEKESIQVPIQKFPVETVNNVLYDIHMAEKSFLEGDCDTVISKIKSLPAGVKIPFFLFRAQEVCLGLLNKNNDKMVKEGYLALMDLNRENLSLVDHLQKKNAFEKSIREDISKWFLSYQSKYNILMKGYIEETSEISPDLKNKILKTYESNQDSFVFETYQALSQMDINAPILKIIRAEFVVKIEDILRPSLKLLSQKLGEGLLPESREYAKALVKRYPSSITLGYVWDIFKQHQVSLVEEPSVSQGSVLEGNVSGLSPEKALEVAQKALDSGNLIGAYDILSQCSDPNHYQVVRFKTEVMERHVQEMRMNVTELYKRSQNIPKEGKLNALKQALQQLESILTRYPKTTGRSGIERSIRAIQNEIRDLSKGK